MLVNLRVVKWWDAQARKIRFNPDLNMIQKPSIIPILDLRASEASQYSYAFPPVLPSLAWTGSITNYSTMKGASSVPEHIVIKTCTCPVGQLGGRHFLTPKNFKSTKFDTLQHDKWPKNQGMLKKVSFYLFTVLYFLHSADFHIALSDTVLFLLPDQFATLHSLHHLLLEVGWCRHAWHSC